MALSSSNLLAGSGNTGQPAAQTALTSAMQPGFSASQLANLSAKGVNGSTVSLSPTSGGSTQPVVKPTTVATPSTASAPASAGTYKGVNITPGTDAQIAAQVAQIDAGGTAGGSATVPTYTYTPPTSGGTTGATTTATTSTGTTTPAPTYSGLVGSLANVAQNGSQGVQDANKALAAFNTSVAGEYAGIGASPTSARIMQGRDQAVQLANAQTEAALQSQVTNALTGQGQQISGLGTAAGLAAPALGSYGSTYYNPLTGQSESSSGAQLDPQTQATSLAQQVISGQTSYDQAVASMGYAGSAGTTFLNNAITAAGGNPLSLQATGAGTQAGIQTTTANTGAITASQQTQVANYESARQQGEALASQVNDLISSFGLNPSDVNAVNAGIQKIASNTSNPQYQILSNYLNDIAARYSQVLTPPGGSATDTTRAIATGMLNATAQGTSIQAVLASLDQQAQAVIASVPTTGGAAASNTSGGTSGSTGGTIQTAYGTINPNL